MELIRNQKQQAQWIILLLSWNKTKDRATHKKLEILQYFPNLENKVKVQMNLEERERLYTAGVQSYFCSHCREQCGGSSRNEKWNHHMPQPFHFWVHIWKNKNTNSKRHVHLEVHSSNGYSWRTTCSAQPLGRVQLCRGLTMAPPSMGFSSQEHWSGLSCPPPGDLPNPGIEPRSPALQVDSLVPEPPGKKPLTNYRNNLNAHQQMNG